MEEQFESIALANLLINKRLIWVADTSHSVSWVILAISIIYALGELTLQFFIYPSPAAWRGPSLFNSILYVLGHVDKVLYAGFAYLVLQAISEIIYLLMDIRGAIQPEEGERDAVPENV